MRLIISPVCECGARFQPFAICPTLEASGLQLSCPRCLSSIDLRVQGHDSVIPDTIEGLEL